MSAIWIAEKQDESEIFLRARKAFDVECPDGPYVLRLTCSGRYRLWMNGEYVLRGPAHSGTQVKRVDELDVSGYLKSGVNRIAVQLIHFRYCTAQGYCPAPAFQLSLQGAGVDLESDASWKVSMDEAFRLPSFRRNTMYGPQELYDAREEESWQGAAYDDSAWPLAVEVRVPWGTEIPRGIPFLKELDVRPVAVVKTAEVVDQEHFPEMWRHQSYTSLAVSLLQDVPEPPSLTRICNAESLLGRMGRAMTVTQPFINDPDCPERRCATVIFDFGKEITGYGWFEAEGNAGAIIDAVYGETLTAGRVQAMRQGTHYADRYTLREGRQRHEVYDWKGFRYIQLTFRNLTRPLTVSGLGVTFSSYPVQYRGELRCGEDLLEKIWQTGAYTQQLCMHDRLMDCPWREQVQWLGDGRIQLVVIQNAFGANEICRKFVEDFAQSQYENGLIPSMSGKKESQDIIDYALLWIVALHDTVLFDGDARFAREMLPAVERLLVFFKPYVNDDGLIENIPGWVFIDWALIGRSGCVAPLNAIYYMALKSAEYLGRQAESNRFSARCREASLLIEKNFHRIFWSKEKRLYRDCIAPDEPDAGRTCSQHTQAIAVLTGLSRMDSRELMSRTLADPKLVQASPFFSYYLLEALSRAGLGKEALEFIRSKWGSMIDGGATTFWEEWQTDGTYRDGYWAARPRSFCHAWSAAPTAWMSRHLLGVRQEETDGSLLFAPALCGLTEAEGSVPTRYGVIQVAWNVTGEKFSAELTLPPGCPNPVFCPPAEFKDRSGCTVQYAAEARCVYMPED